MSSQVSPLTVGSCRMSQQLLTITKMCQRFFCVYIFQGERVRRSESILKVVGITGAFQLFPPSVNSCIMALGRACPQVLSSFQAKEQ